LNSDLCHCWCYHQQGLLIKSRAPDRHSELDSESAGGVLLFAFFLIKKQKKIKKTLILPASRFFIKIYG
jgi:hypothetical protein